MVEIECHLCEENFSPNKCIDTNNYDGEVKCPKCGAILHVKLARGKLQKRKVVDRGNYWIHIATADDLEKHYGPVIKELLNKMQEEEKRGNL